MDLSKLLKWGKRAEKPANTPSEPISLSELKQIVAQATQSNRLGRDPKRPSYEVTSKFREELQVRLEQIDDTALLALADEVTFDTLRTVVDSSIAPEHIPFRFSTLSAVSGEIRRRSFVRENGTPNVSAGDTALRLLSHKPSNLDELLAMERTRVAASLVHTVGLVEGLFGPNNLGYVPDQFSAIQTMGSVAEAVKYSYLDVTRAPNVLGPETPYLYNGVINRLQNDLKQMPDLNRVAVQIPVLPLLNESEGG
jgi:hypothetical protein